MSRSGGVKARLAMAAFLLAGGVAWSQELIVNPGFETFSQCPTGPGQVDGRCDSWYRGSVASTDFFHRCGFSPRPPRSGEGHLGILAYDSSPDYREYAVGMPASPLVAGRQYRFQMWVLLDPGYLIAVAELGAHFSDARPMWPGTAPPGVTPQAVNSSGILDDKVDWTLIDETFVAAGGERAEAPPHRRGG